MSFSCRIAIQAVEAGRRVSAKFEAGLVRLSRVVGEVAFQLLPPAFVARTFDGAFELSQAALVGVHVRH